jgi:hypothetical protein
MKEFTVGIKDLCAAKLPLSYVQSEERTLWEARETYIEMSPFMLADRITKPLLLIHGEDDNNSGTLTIQVMSLFHNYFLCYICPWLI